LRYIDPIHQNYYQLNKQAISEYQKEYNQLNKDKIALKDKEYRLKQKQLKQQAIEQAIQDLHIAVERVPE